MDKGGEEGCPRWRPSTIAEEEDGEAGEQAEEALEGEGVVYEEDMPVVVRRRGLTMTVRIFGAETPEPPGGWWEAGG